MPTKSKTVQEEEQIRMSNWTGPRALMKVCYSAVRDPAHVLASRFGVDRSI
jgi:hypothetical protein